MSPTFNDGGCSALNYKIYDKRIKHIIYITKHQEKKTIKNNWFTCNLATNSRQSYIEQGPLWVNVHRQVLFKERGERFTTIQILERARLDLVPSFQQDRGQVLHQSAVCDDMAPTVF